MTKPAEPTIVTQYIYPPIPTRKFDWMAYVDGREENEHGFGATESAAIEDLKWQLAEAELNEADEREEAARNGQFGVRA